MRVTVHVIFHVHVRLHVAVQKKDSESLYITVNACHCFNITVKIAHYYEPFEQERVADNTDRAEGHCGTGHPRLEGKTNR